MHVEDGRGHENDDAGVDSDLHSALREGISRIVSDECKRLYM